MIEQLLQAIPHCWPSVPVVCWTIRLLKERTKFSNEKLEEEKVVSTFTLALLLSQMQILNWFLEYINFQSRPNIWASQLSYHVTLNE